ncbi:MAG: hypothetical protein HGA31_00990 [Candidatus Moranbacteria bacterium]|nr:hypothetical protein [Candidatus Moranbacteria bacterium]
MHFADDVLTFFGSHWLLIAFMAPVFWSLVNVIDVYFVDGIYKDALDGAIISGLFQIVPWPFLIFLVGLKPTDFFQTGVLGQVLGLNAVFILSLAGGVVYALGIYFYFKALFSYNDAPFLQLVANFSVVTVPILSFLMFRETLPLMGYVGMAVTLSGAAVLSGSSYLRKRFSGKYFSIMLGAVLFLSLSMIIENRAYGLLADTYGEKGFWMGFLFFSLGAFSGGLLFSFYSMRNPFSTIRKYYKVFFLGEGLYFLGNLALQRAIGTAPSVSYVAVIETFGPVFIMLYSLIIVAGSRFVFVGKAEMFRRIYSEQTKGIWMKALATVIMAFGVFIMTS